EVHPSGTPRAVVEERRPRTVQEAVLVLARPVDEIERERRAAIAHAERMERAAPALERIRETEVRIELALDVAAAQVAEVPRIEGARPVRLLERRELRGRLGGGA